MQHLRVEAVRRFWLGLGKQVHARDNFAYANDADVFLGISLLQDIASLFSFSECASR